jgi:glycine/serine hydroxymethyltransferase
MDTAAFFELTARVAAEERNSVGFLHLTANENTLSKTAARFQSGPLYGRYHLGRANKREIAKHGTTFAGLYHKSLPALHEMEEQAYSASARIFGAAYSDFRPLSGVHAIIATLCAVTSVGDLVYCFRPDQAGHFATTRIIEQLGRRCRYLPWDNATSDLDFVELQAAFAREPPACIYLDHSNSLFPLNLSFVRAIAGGGVNIIYDGSHPLGLIAGGVFPNPLANGVDILQGNTHKSFPGPQKGVILTNSSRLAERIDRTLNTFVSSQHSGDTLALYTTVLEMETFGAEYARQVVENARTLSTALVNQGIRVFQRHGVATCSHQFLITGFAPGEHLEAAERLLSCGISVNAKHALEEPVIRIGVQETTRMGMKKAEMETISTLFVRALQAGETPAAIRRDVFELVGCRKGVCYSFDSTNTLAAPRTAYHTQTTGGHI